MSDPPTLPDMQKFTARYRRSGEWLAIEVFDAKGERVKGVHSQAKRVEEIEDRARESVSMLLDLPESDVEIQVEEVVV